MNTSYSFAMITPSYAPDFERCRLLCQTLDKHSLSPVKHYIIVDRQDLQLFQQLQQSHREIITVESVLPWWIKKVSLFKNGWISFQTLPLRNWIIQQIVKLSMAGQVTEDVLVFVDSDVAFIRPFNVQNFVKDGKIRLFREPNAIDANTEPLAQWCDVSHKLLGLPAVSYPTANYLGNFITWKRENVFALHQHLEKVSGKNWIKTIASSWQLSEYMLYGTFIDSVLQENSGQYYDPHKVCHNYWETTPMSPEQLKTFFHELPEDYFSIMISAKSGMSTQDYAGFLAI